MRALVAGFLMLAAGVAPAADIVSARYDEPTDRYPHGVLGDDIEHGALVLKLATGKRVRIVLPASRVFEDTEPRLFDVDLDGEREAIVVESHNRLGARLSIYGSDGLESSNEHIGQSNRWLAPAGVGAADLDGDGQVELAFVDRPHLAKILRVYRYKAGSLDLVGSLPGVTNHRIGERDIAGGIRDCGTAPEIIVADASWRSVLAVRFDGAEFTARVLGPHKGRGSFAKALACQN